MLSAVLDNLRVYWPVHLLLAPRVMAAARAYFAKMGGRTST